MLVVWNKEIFEMDFKSFSEPLVLYINFSQLRSHPDKFALTNLTEQGGIWQEKQNKTAVMEKSTALSSFLCCKSPLQSRFFFLSNVAVWIFSCALRRKITRSYAIDYNCFYPFFLIKSAIFHILWTTNPINTVIMAVGAQWYLFQNINS